MIVWAGNGGDNTGGRYNPNTDSWTVTSTTNAPTSRFAATAVWTGSKMIVWGGDDNITYFNTGGSYDPSTNSWVRTSTRMLLPADMNTQPCGGNSDDRVGWI